MRSASALLAARYPFVNALLTKRPGVLIALCAGAMLAVQLVPFGYAIATSENNMTVFGPVVGGDFAIFDAVAGAVADGDGAAMYDPAALAERLQESVRTDSPVNVSWQYPPTMFFLLWPLAFLPYLPGYALWLAAGAGLFTFVARTVWPNGLALFALLAAPAVFQAVITGQTGLFTAAMLAGAAYKSDERWLAAGLAAALLTVKPQLGLLLPVAFLAAGCWRAVAAAAAAALGFMTASVFAFGAQSWVGFFGAVTHHGERLQSAVFPFEKLVSAYGGAAMLGVPPAPAMTLQAVVTLSLAVTVGLVWRRTRDADLRLGALSATALLASPYAFYYEMPVALLALFVLAKRGTEKGWLYGERPALALLWLAPLFVLVAGNEAGAPLGAAVSFGTVVIMMRRALTEIAASPAVRR